MQSTLDGTPECIPARASGQQFFCEIYPASRDGGVTMPSSYNLSIFFDMRDAILAACLAANRLNAIDCAQGCRNENQGRQLAGGPSGRQGTSANIHPISREIPPVGAPCRRCAKLRGFLKPNSFGPECGTGWLRPNAKLPDALLLPDRRWSERP